MRGALARHDTILRTAIETHGGHVFSTAGDAFAAVFARVRDAIHAAVEAQDVLLADAHPEYPALRVRMGVHTGEAEERGGDYFGPAVNRAARVMDAGHGGQVLISDVTAALVDGVDLIDLGEHLLKSLDAPIRLHQVVIERSTASFPPLRTVGAAASTIRRPRRDLIGRIDDIARIRAALSQDRLVTISGAGGVGKTRLALEVGNGLIAEMSAGVAFVDLSKVTDETMVASAIAEGIGLALGGSTEAAEAVRRHLTTRTTLLVIDNCEHVIEEVADLVDALLESCPNVRVLATSREALAVDGERVVGLRGMNLDEAIELFSRSANRSAENWSAEELASVTEICRRLDGLPLAIELAAARTSVLNVEEIAAHLDDRFAMLTGGRRRTRGRSQTLLATVQWSFDLLEPDQQAALAALSVMPSSFGLQLARRVLGVSELAAVDELEDLTARSLLQADLDAADPHDRYRLLETIRVFAADQLRAGTQEHAVRDRHLEAVVELLGERDIWASVEQVRLGDDALAAFEWARRSGRVVDACRMAQTVVDTLVIRGAPSRALEMIEWAATVDDPVEAAAMWAIGTWIGIWQLDAPLIHRCAAAGVDAAPTSLGAARCRHNRAMAWNFMDPGRAKRDIDQARQVIATEGTRMDRANLLWAESSTLLFADLPEEAAVVARAWLEHTDEHGTSFDSMARESLAVALISSGSMDELRVEVDRGHDQTHSRWAVQQLLEYGHRSWMGVALAHLGDVNSARKVIAELWADRPDHEISYVDSNVSVALAECAFLAGESREAQTLLDASDHLARTAGAEVMMYWRLAALAGVERSERRAWAADELVRRFTRDLTTDRPPVAHAINAELRRLGLR